MYWTQKMERLLYSVYPLQCDHIPKLASEEFHHFSDVLGCFVFWMKPLRTVEIGFRNDGIPVVVYCMLKNDASTAMEFKRRSWFIEWNSLKRSDSTEWSSVHVEAWQAQMLIIVRS